MVRAPHRRLEAMAMSDVPPLTPFWTGGPPVVDPVQVTPSVDEVASLERTRTLDNSGQEQETFTSSTRPTDVEAQTLIGVAADEVLARLPTNIDPAFYPSIAAVISLRAASLIEVSYYREQALSGGSDGTAATWTGRYQAGLDALQKIIAPGPNLPLVA
jgi:hypothetical protein